MQLRTLSLTDMFYHSELESRVIITSLRRVLVKVSIKMMIVTYGGPSADIFMGCL